MKRYKIKFNNKDNLRYLNCYTVESIYDCHLIYLADQTGFALLRSGDLAILDFDEAIDVLSKIQFDDIKKEAIEVFNDFMEIRRYGCSNWHYTGSEVLGDRITESNRRRAYGSS